MMPGTRPPFQGDSLGDVFPRAEAHGLFCFRPLGDGKMSKLKVLYKHRSCFLRVKIRKLARAEIARFGINPIHDCRPKVGLREDAQTQVDLF